jgi:hypothetical protein
MASGIEIEAHLADGTQYRPEPLRALSADDTLPFNPFAASESACSESSANAQVRWPAPKRQFHMHKLCCSIFDS